MITRTTVRTHMAGMITPAMAITMACQPAATRRSASAWR
jgi:hypothetical protein